MLANLAPRARCQAPLRSQNRNAGKSSPRTRCQAPLRSRIEMLANLVPESGARHRLTCPSKSRPRARCQAPFAIPGSKCWQISPPRPVPGTFAIPKIGMLANLVPAPGARHLCDPESKCWQISSPSQGARHRLTCRKFFKVFQVRDQTCHSSRTNFCHCRPPKAPKFAAHGSSLSLQHPPHTKNRMIFFVLVSASAQALCSIA